MAITLSLLAAVLFGLAGWWMKMSQMNNGSIKSLMIAMYAIGTSCFFIHAIVEGSFAVLLSFNAIILGIIIGLGSGLGNYLFMLALERGPASLISPLSNTNIIIVVLLGVVIYNESLSMIQLVSILFLFLATILISQKKNKDCHSSLSWLWITFAAIILFACRNGGIKVVEELNMDSAPILCLAYFISLLLFLMPAFNRGDLPHASTKVGWKFGILTGVFSYGGLQLFAIAMTYGQASIVAPIFATNGLIVTIGSILFYKERLNTIQTIAFVCLFIGLIGIRLSL